MGQNIDIAESLMVVLSKAQEWLLSEILFFTFNIFKIKSGNFFILFQKWTVLTIFFITKIINFVLNIFLKKI
jgi:hypothetical protein